MLLNINKMDLFHAFAKLELPFALEKAYRIIVGDFDDRPMFEDYVLDVIDADAIYQLIIDRILTDPEELKIVPNDIPDEPSNDWFMDMMHVFHPLIIKFPEEMDFCAAVCAVSHGLAGTSYERLLELVKPQLVDEDKRYRLYTVDAAMMDIEVLKIYDDHVRNVDHRVPYKHGHNYYLDHVEEKISMIISDYGRDKLFREHDIDCGVNSV